MFVSQGVYFLDDVDNVFTGLHIQTYPQVAAKYHYYLLSVRIQQLERFASILSYNTMLFRL